MRRSLRGLAALLQLLLLILSPAFAGDRPLIAFGDSFPELSLALTERDHDRSYLGLPAGQGFSPGQINADLVLVELLNVHCVHCQQQAPYYNELFKRIERDPATRGRIKLLGIAVGNLPEEVETFRKSYQVPFPIVADPRFVAHRALGSSATPFSIYLRQDSSGRPGVVAETHLGLNTDLERVFTQLRQLSTADVATLRREGAVAVRKRTAITPLYGEEQLAQRVKKAFTETGGELVNFERVDLRSGRRVYSAVLRSGEKYARLFAEVVSRQSVCDVCHDVHFIYVFDTSTRIVGFEPLQVTKYGNQPWSAAETESMRRRVVGRHLSNPRPFDPKVDAVTSATISSAIIFDSIDQGQALVEELQTRGY
jgi:hypothetical protein